MPHIKLECTANLKMDFQAFFKELADRMVDTGHAPRLGIKCRVEYSDEYFIIDGKNKDYKMVNLVFGMREGRSDDVLKNFSEIGIALLSKYLKKDIDHKQIIISTEIKELIKGRDLTQNHIK